VYVQRTALNVAENGDLSLFALDDYDSQVLVRLVERVPVSEALLDSGEFLCGCSDHIFSKSNRVMVAGFS
jgi:hypothetical protein